jgi:hypothetical protein
MDQKSEDTDVSDNRARNSSPSEQDERSGPRIVIVEDGDIILECAGGGKIQVSSTVLQYASPVFAAMLSRKFSEGQSARSSTDPKAIAVPEDNFEAMRQLCAVIHLKSRETLAMDNHPIEELGRRLLQFSILVDKYDCVESLYLQNETLLGRSARREADTTPPFECMADFAVSAYLLRQEVYFALFTRRLIMRYNDHFSALCNHNISQILPSIVLCECPPSRSHTGL